MQKEPTKKAAGKRNAGANPPRKLSRVERKQIAEVIRQAKGDGKAHTAQQTIPYIQMYPDGICKVSEKKYSTIQRRAFRRLSSEVSGNLYQGWLSERRRCHRPLFRQRHNGGSRKKP